MWLCKLSCLVKLFLQMLHEYGFPLVIVFGAVFFEVNTALDSDFLFISSSRCKRMCTSNLDMIGNFLKHTEHSKGRSPCCVCIWMFKRNLFLNLFEHNEQIAVAALSVFTRWWSLMLASIFGFMSPLWTTLIWFLSVGFALKLASHWVHLNGFSPRMTEEVILQRFFSSETFSHTNCT